MLLEYGNLTHVSEGHFIICVMRRNFSVEWICLTVLWQFSVKAPYGFLCYLNVASQSNLTYAYTLFRLIAIADYAYWLWREKVAFFVIYSITLGPDF